MAKIIFNVESVWHSDLNTKIRSYSDDSEWNISSNRFVAFLDILGFKKLVENSFHGDLMEKFEFITEKKNIINNGKDDKIKPINIVAFSDSIVIFSKNDTFETFEVFLYAVSWIFSEIIKEKIPIKGAFAHGLMTADFSKEIFFGMPLIKAYEIEELTHFMGLVPHDSIINYIDAAADKLKQDVFINQTINMKTEKGESFEVEKVVLNAYPFFVIDENRQFPEIMNEMSESIYKYNSLKTYNEYLKVK